MATMPEQKPGRSKQDYGTPKVFLDAVKMRLGIEEFDIDLAADEHNRVSDCYFDEAMNGLKQDWYGFNGWNWLNPPFSHIAPWVERAYTQAVKHNVHTAVLIPAGVGSNWWRDWADRKANILLLNGRITFVGCEDPYPKDCALLLYPGRLCKDMGMQYRVWSWTK